jgi:hypothetical protein
MNVLIKIAVFSILLVIYIELLSCYLGNWCINDPRRAGRNIEMIGIYLSAGILTCVSYLFIEYLVKTNKK